MLVKPALEKPSRAENSAVIVAPLTLRLFRGCKSPRSLSKLTFPVPAVRVRFLGVVEESLKIH